jgi:hypothetical protein
MFAGCKLRNRVYNRSGGYGASLGLTTAKGGIPVTARRKVLTGNTTGRQHHETAKGLAAAQPAGRVSPSITTPDTVESRIGTLYYYGVFGASPAEGMRLSGVGSQYLVATIDAGKQYFDGAKTYRVTLPKGIPARGPSGGSAGMASAVSAWFCNFAGRFVVYPDVNGRTTSFLKEENLE